MECYDNSNTKEAWIHSLHISKHIPEHIIPVFFDKINFFEWNVEMVTNELGIFSVLVCCTHPRFICLVPVCHK